MAAAPQYGTLVFKGMNTGKTYVKDVYFSDVANALATFDVGAGAGASSPDFITFPENVVLIDFSVVTGLTDTTKGRLARDSIPSGNILRWSIHLTTLAKRPQLTVFVKAGTRFSIIQLA